MPLLVKLPDGRNYMRSKKSHRTLALHSNREADITYASAVWTCKTDQITDRETQPSPTYSLRLSSRSHIFDAWSDAECTTGPNTAAPSSAKLLETIINKAKMPVSEMSVQRELEKNPEIKLEDVKNIREWLSTQPHLPCEHITHLDIILAYHSCERNMDETKKVIDHNFSLRTLFSFYQDRKIDRSLENALQTWLISPLATLMAGGHRAIYCQLLNADTNKFVYSDVVRAFMMVMDLWQLEEGTAPGVAVVVNMDRVSLGHLYQIDLVVAQQFFYFLQEAMFVRLKEFHFINAPSFIDRLLSMIKPFIKEDLMQKLKIHTIGSNTLDKYISRIDFLREIGELSVGDNRDKMWKKLKENRTYFEEESKKRVDESKRPDTSPSAGSIFSGMETTFRRLEID